MPGLWEAQGHLDLDGTAWYRRSFRLEDAAGHWTIRFGAVMDLAAVYLNGQLLGTHESAYTPFEVDATPVLAAGDNILALRVVDPPLGDPEHGRLAHGKQGWASHVYPSRPSLYLTYGGIWQPVALLRHGQVVVRDVFVTGDPDDLVVSADARNVSAETARARVTLNTLGLAGERELDLAPGERRRLEWRLGATDAARWAPDAPALHTASLEATVGGMPSDGCSIRYGLRTVRVEGSRVLLNGEPYAMKSGLVQGFRAEELYADGDREAIRDEVLAARKMGFNTLRLHIKAFDPAYLDVCDELGMLLHCDVPVAEPIAYEELGPDTVLARRCVAAAEEQVRRDRNHPSIVLWSAMNEIGDQRHEVRSWPAYQGFVRALVGAIERADPTRPVIENDWGEPDPERVFAGHVLTAHWYGRLSSDYLARTDAKAARAAADGRPFFVTEFGTWGLPDMPELAEPPFWDTREAYVTGLAATLWPGAVDEFVAETHRYQGLCDRVHAELFRRHPHIGGYCVTELTDVPHELNGLLDIHRRPKPRAAAEMRSGSPGPRRPRTSCAPASCARTGRPGSASRASPRPPLRERTSSSCA